MYCRNCGKEVNEKAIACPSCGVPPRVEKKFCHNCGVETQGNQILCVKCGVSLSGTSSGKSKIAAGVLALTLGAYGGHQFYLGNTGSAVIRLVVSIIGIFLFGIPTIPFVVIGIIEGIKYLSMEDHLFEFTYVKNKKSWF